MQGYRCRPVVEYVLPFYYLIHMEQHRSNRSSEKMNRTVDDQGMSHVYIAQNGSPEHNIEKVMDMLGGVNLLIGQRDIIIIKPNTQWWNQGMTNTDAVRGFIDLILAMEGCRI